VPNVRLYARQRILDDADDLIAAEAVTHRVAHEGARLKHKLAACWRSRDGDPSTATDVEEAFLTQRSKRAQDGIRIHAEHGGEIARWRQPLPDAHLTIGDRASDGGCDLLVQVRRPGLVDLGIQNCAI
jgi:hypothetical protein